MKLLLREYVAALKERGELDAILPDLLSELGYNVFSFPKRGTAQRGVDIGAERIDEHGIQRVYLFTLKQGDLTRQDWDGSPQAVRPSLNEILDTYIPNRLPPHLRGLPVVICLVFGGNVREQVRESLTSFTTKYSTDQISFVEWNGDYLAGLLLTGLLREELLPASMRSLFQKAVALVDEPHASIVHFRNLATALHEAANADAKVRTRSARQLNICLWVLYVWAREAGNLEAAFLGSEIVVLAIWDLMRLHIDSQDKTAEDMSRVVSEVISLHITILGSLVDEKIMPYVAIRHGLTSAVPSHRAIDKNLALFDVLGRIALAGIWLDWLRQRDVDIDKDALHEASRAYLRGGVALIENNPVLLLPATDHQATDIALFLMLWLTSATAIAGSRAWLVTIVERLDYTLHTHGQYPCTTSDYRDLAEHPRHRSDAYLEEMTSASTLVPLIAAWLAGLRDQQGFGQLAKVVREKLQHCTLQFWLPDSDTDASLFHPRKQHGRALCGLSLDEGADVFLDMVKAACHEDDGFSSLSAMQTGYWPILLLACRHHRLPLPPHLWLPAFRERFEPGPSEGSPSEQPE